MNYRIGKRASTILLCAIMALSLIVNVPVSAKADECPLYGQHKLDGAVMFEAAHPHKQYTVCDCGFAQYTGGTVDYYAECEVCNPQECQHPNTDTAWDTNYSMNYVSISDTQHQVTGYQYKYCTNCFERIGSSFQVTETYSHDFNSNGDCPTCGYTHACAHSRTKLVAIDGYPAYTQYSETQHIVDTQYKEVCRDCGEVVRQIVDSARDYEYEDHDFNKKGVCRDCGYVKPEEQEELKISVSANQSSAEAGDLISASASATGGDGSYSFAWTVTCNGSTVANTDLSYGNNYSVTASQAGSYVFTATVRDGNGNQVSASSGSITVEEPACQHPTTEVAWDTNYSITYVSVSDTEHEMTGYQYRYCTVCFERVGSSFAVTERMSHDFDSAGDCPTCGYTYECKHTNTKYEVIDGYPAYEYYNDEEHTIDTQYKEVCLDCGKVVKNVVDSQRTYVHEAHTYDSNGKCTGCGFIKPEEQEELKISVSANQSTVEIGATITANATALGGTGSYSYAWKVTCNGSVIAETDLSYGADYSVKANVAGSYVFTATVQDSKGNQASGSSNAVTAEEPACQHPTTEVAWDTNYSITYVSVSDTEHEMTGYQYRYCTVCFQRVGESYAVTETMGHDFDSAGDCPTCGYTYSCKHENTKFVPIDGYPAYHQHDEKQHIYDVQFKEVCTNPMCGKTVKNIVDSERIYEYQDHRFDENGKCQDCGYIKPEEQKPLEVTVSRGQATAKTGETITAKALVAGGDGSYKYSWKVLLDDEEVKSTDLSMGDSYSWEAETAGTYTFTVTVVDGNDNSVTGSSQGIVVSQNECAHESYTDIPGTVTYEQVSDAKHNKITLMSRVCDNCGETISEFKKEESEDHTFENGVCTSCGLAEPTAECQHEHTEEKLTGSKITNQGDTNQHIVTEAYSVICQDCGITVRTFEKKVPEDHAFNAEGVCACGYAKPTPECDHANRVEVQIGTPTYVNNSDKGHTKTVKVRIECADCGIVLEEEKTVTTTENHKFENGACVCGQAEHVHTYEKVIIGQSNYVNQNTNEHDVTVTYVMKCSGCGDTTAQQTETTREGHTYTTKGRIEAKHQSGLGHATFDRCVCGAVRYTGYAKYNNCCECYGHSWGDAYEQNGQWMHKCSRCGIIEYTSAPEENQCDHIEQRYEGDTKYSPYDDLQHMKELSVHYSCACGKISYNTIEFGLEAHVLKNGVCSVCGYDSHDALDTIIAQLEDNSESSDISTWEHYAESATKLLNGPHFAAATKVFGHDIDVINKNDNEAMIDTWKFYLGKTLQGYNSCIDECLDSTSLQRIKNGVARISGPTEAASKTMESIKGLFDEYRISYNRNGSMLKSHADIAQNLGKFTDIIDSVGDILDLLDVYFSREAVVAQNKEELEVLYEVATDYVLNKEKLEGIMKSTNDPQLIQACKEVISEMKAFYNNDLVEITKIRLDMSSKENKAGADAIKGLLINKIIEDVSAPHAVQHLAGGLINAKISDVQLYETAAELYKISLLDQSIIDETLAAISRQGVDDYYITELYTVIQIYGSSASIQYLEDYNYTTTKATSTGLSKEELEQRKEQLISSLIDILNSQNRLEKIMK